MATQTIVPPALTIGGELERRRLEHRARRVEVALAALRRLSDARASGGRVPAPLGHAMSGFSRDLADINRRLRDL